MGGGESHLILRAGGNLILEKKKESEARRKKELCHVHAMSQNQAGNQTKDSRLRGAIPWVELTAPVSSCCSVQRWPAWTCPPTLSTHCPGETTDPWGGLGLLKPDLASPQSTPSPCQAGAIIALTGPWGRRGRVFIHMSQVSRAETSGRATSHAFSLVTAPHKPLPALFLAPLARGSWQLHSPGFCCFTSPSPPPAHCKPSLSPTGRGRNLPVQVEGPWAGSPRQWRLHQKIQPWPFISPQSL